MTIDTAIINHKMQANASRNHNDRRGVFYSAEEHEQIVEWLKELKVIKSDGFTDDLLNMGYTKGYNKAIEECIKIIEETIWRDTDMLVENIRELMNGGAE